MGKPSDRVQLFTPEQAAAAFDGCADLTALVLKADIGQAETAAMIYVNKGDYTEPWPHQDPASRGTLLVPHQLDKVLQMLHKAWREALLALEPGDRDLDPKSPEITALQRLALTSTDKRLHRNELRRWAEFNDYETAEFDPTEPQTAPALTDASDTMRRDGLPTPTIAVCFDGAPFTENEWNKRIHGKKWLNGARRAMGAQGGAPAMWCPLEIGKLVWKKYPNQRAKLKRAFQNLALAQWRDEWEQFIDLFSDDD